MKILTFELLSKELLEIFKNKEFANTGYIRDILKKKKYTHYKNHNSYISSLENFKIGSAISKILWIKIYSRTCTAYRVYCKK